MTAPPQEVELKFLCAPDDLAAVLAAAPAGDDESRELISVYFDTPGHTLEKAGVSLRVRESQGRRVQTLKRGSGLIREEHEAPIHGLTPQRDLGPLKGLLAAGESLKPAFNVRVTRRQRTLRYKGAEIEIALDQGEVAGGRARSPICEVELELKSGPASSLFDLADDLSQAVPLYLSFDGKAMRGQALVAGEPLKPRASPRIVISKAATVAQAFQAVARAALSQIAANAVVLRDAPQAEAVHQLRVGVRRLRSAFSTFGPAVRDGGLAALKAELRWLAKACDPARNLDVFAETVLEPAQRLTPALAGLKALEEAVEAARAAARAEAAAAVSTQRFRRLMLNLARWIEIGDWQSTRTPAGGSARIFARAALDKRRRKLLKRARKLPRLDDRERHQLRIEAKKLRYAADGFISLYPGKSSAKFMSDLKALQARLGELNDIATAEPLTATLSLGPDASGAAEVLIALRRDHKAKLVRQTDQAWRRLAKADPYWR